MLDEVERILRLVLFENIQAYLNFMKLKTNAMRKSIYVWSRCLLPTILKCFFNANFCYWQDMTLSDVVIYLELKLLSKVYAVLTKSITACKSKLLGIILVMENPNM